MQIEYTLEREVFHREWTQGKLYRGEELIGYTCEDTDRYLEEGGKKLQGQTAIPRGRYQFIVSISNRFKKTMPEILGVPLFSGIRIHGGNTHENTEGCPLLGETPTNTGVANCAKVNAELILQLLAAERRGDECWITVK